MLHRRGCDEKVNGVGRSLKLLTGEIKGLKFWASGLLPLDDPSGFPRSQERPIDWISRRSMPMLESLSCLPAVLGGPLAAPLSGVGILARPAG